MRDAALRLVARCSRSTHPVCIKAGIRTITAAAQRRNFTGFPQLFQLGHDSQAPDAIQNGRLHDVIDQ